MNRKQTEIDWRRPLCDAAYHLFNLDVRQLSEGKAGGVLIRRQRVPELANTTADPCDNLFLHALYKNIFVISGCIHVTSSNIVRQCCSENVVSGQVPNAPNISIAFNRSSVYTKCVSFWRMFRGFVAIYLSHHFIKKRGHFSITGILIFFYTMQYLLFIIGLNG